MAFKAFQYFPNQKSVEKNLTPPFTCYQTGVISLSDIFDTFVVIPK